MALKRYIVTSKGRAVQTEFGPYVLHADLAALAKRLRSIAAEVYHLNAQCERELSAIADELEGHDAKG